MFKPLPLFVGLRYVRAKRDNHFISFISLLSMLGIALGITALITVISVMNGFEQELKARILDMTPHATIYSGYGEGLRDWRAAKALADQHPKVIGSAPFVQKESMLVNRQRVKGALLQGVDPALEPQVSKVGEKMVAGSLEDLKPGGFGIILGQELANALGVYMGDKLTVISPQALATVVGVVPRMKRFEVVGIFEIGMHQFDSAVALVNIEDAAKFYRMGDKVSGLRLETSDMLSARKINREVALSLGGVYRITDWTQQHANFFRAIATEKVVMFVILFLIVAVAAFNIVATLVMMVTDKQADIAILRTLGFSAGQVMRVFVVQGCVIGFVGTLLGVVGGVALALNVENIVPALESLLGRQFMSADIYYITDLRGDLHWHQVGLIAGLSFVMSVLSTLYPALRAARTQPAEALRYE